MPSAGKGEGLAYRVAYFERIGGISSPGPPLCGCALAVASTSEVSMTVDRGFCPAQSCSLSVPQKHTEVYINYNLVDLISSDFLLTLITYIRP